MAVAKMSRHDMKQDDLVTAIEKTRGYIDKNPSTARNALIAAAAVVVLAGGFFWWRSSTRAAAAELASEAHTRMMAPVVASGANPTSPFSPSFATEADRDRAALESYTKLAEQYGSSAEGRLARYYQGVLFARAGKAQEAEAALEEFAGRTSSPLLGDLARAQLAQLHAQRGDLEGAAKLYSQIADNKDAMYPRDWALYYLADTQERQGKKDEAAKTFALLAKEFPTSTFSAEAARKGQGT